MNGGLIQRVDATGSLIPNDGQLWPAPRGWEDGSQSILRPRKPPLVADSPNYNHTGGLTGLVISPAPCALLWASGFSSAAVGYMWILNATALPAAASALPASALVLYVAAGTPFRLTREDLSDLGLYFSTGLTVAWSTTYATYTAPAAATNLFSAWRWR